MTEYFTKEINRYFYGKIPKEYFLRAKRHIYKVLTVKLFLLCIYIFSHMISIIVKTIKDAKGLSLLKYTYIACLWSP